MYPTSRASLFGNRKVTGSIDLQRIVNLPRRSWTEEELRDLAREMTDLLRTPEGTMSLRTIQALALHDIGTQGGLFAPIRVGGGKTLLSLLAPYILEAERPILLLPAALIEKTHAERMTLSKHWKIPRNLRIISYEMLGRVAGADTFTHYRPDLIIADEAHRLKNKRAGVTRRVIRYMRENPSTKFIAMSGTVMKSSLKDFGNLLRFCLKDNAPIPLVDVDLEEWADCLDEKVNPLQRVDPGALMVLCNEEEKKLEPLTAVRRGFQRRLTETAGVVATSGDEVSCSLYVRALRYDVSAKTEENFRVLRNTWETPDGWPLSMAVDVWRHARELALGFHYVWDPRPPVAWMNARREWAQFVRKTLAHSRTLDTELQVANECAKERSTLDGTAFKSWNEIRPSFTPSSRALWHDDAALQVCQEWITKGPGIVWTEHTFFAEELARRTGLSYYGPQGQNRQGQAIEKADPGSCLIASVAANSTGRNLQAWNRNLITFSPAGAGAWEQLLGRTHRDGQTADEVTVDVMLGCSEHFDGWTKARAGAEAARDTLGQSQKLLIADIVFPTEEEVRRFSGFRWGRSLG